MYHVYKRKYYYNIGKEEILQDYREMNLQEIEQFESMQYNVN